MSRRPSPSTARRAPLRIAVAVAVVASVGAAACSTSHAAKAKPKPAPEPPSSVADRPRPVLSASDAAAWHTAREPGVGGRVTTAWIDPADPAHLVVGVDRLSVSHTFDGGRHWAPSAGLLSYEINRVMSGPAAGSPIWVGTMSGPAVSVDGGRTFVPKRQGMPTISRDAYSAPIDTVLVDPSDAAHVIAFGGSHRDWPSRSPATMWGAVWDSTDGGNTWTHHEDVVTGGNVVSATWTADGSIVAAVRHQGLFRSRDRGRTWSELRASPDDVAEIEASPRDPAVWWVSTATTAASRTGEPAGPGTVLGTSDAGATWSPRDRGLTHITNSSPNEQSQYLALAAAPSKPDVLYTGDDGWDGAKLFRSTDGGQSWRTILDEHHLPNQAYASSVSPREFAIDPSDPDHVVVACDDRVLASTDGGKHWSDLTSSLTTPTGFQGHGFSGIVATDVAFNPFVADDITVTGFDEANPIRTTDGGDSWNRPLGTRIRFGGAYAAAYGSDDTMFVLLGQAGTFGGIARSTDGGRSWSLAEGPTAGLPPLSPGYTAKLSPGSVFAVDTRVVLATIGGDLYRSTDGAAHFTIVDRGHGLGTIASPGDHTGHVFVSGQAGLFESTDDGATFAAVKGAPASPAEFGGLAIGPGDAPPVFMAVRALPGSDGVWRRAGGKWTKVLANDDVYDVAVDPTDPTRVLATTSDLSSHDEMRSTGVWLSTDGGSTWATHNDGLAMLRVPTVAFDPFHGGHAVIGTLGGGFLEAELGATHR